MEHKIPHNPHLLPICTVLLLFRCKRSKIGWKKGWVVTSLKKNNKKKDFSDLPTLIFLDMSLETDIFFFFGLNMSVKFDEEAPNGLVCIRFTAYFHVSMVTLTSDL